MPAAAAAHGARIEISASATRLSEDEFWEQRRALGRSLRRLAHECPPRPAHRASPTGAGCRKSTTTVCLADGPARHLIDSCHDDVWIDDYFLRRSRASPALAAYDVSRRCRQIGAGCRVSRLWAWLYLGNEFIAGVIPVTCSGSVAHGAEPFGRHFVLRRRACRDARLCDSACFPRCHEKITSAFRESGSDSSTSRFDFHFYDMDFCRSARSERPACSRDLCLICLYPPDEARGVVSLNPTLPRASQVRQWQQWRNGELERSWNSPPVTSGTLRRPRGPDLSGVGPV